MTMRKVLAAILVAIFSTGGAYAQSFEGTSPFKVNRGGTGRATLTANAFLVGNGTSPVTLLSCASGAFMAGTAGAPACRAILGSDVTGAALTKVDDTNVTLTLGGTPATSLLRAASITAGWAGQLSPSRGGTGIASFSIGDIIIATGTTTLGKLAIGAQWTCPASTGVTLTALGCREKLTANRDYYVRSDGSDSNTGLINSAGGAFLTVQKAIDVILTNIDFGCKTVTVNVNGSGGAGSTFVGAANIQGLFVGKCSGSAFTIRGIGTKPTLEVTSSNLVNVGEDNGNGSSIYLTNLNLHTITAGACIRGLNGSTQIVFDTIDFNCATYGIEMHHSAYAGLLGNYTVSGGGISHIFCVSGSICVIRDRTVTFSNSPVFTTYAIVAGAELYAANMTFTNGGTVSGSKYACTDHGLCVTAAATTYFPGTTAGSTANLGLYVGLTTLIGLDTTVVVPCGTLTFESGLLTNKGAC